MNAEVSVWHIGHDSALKRVVRIEVIGKSFALYEQLWRSEAYFFDDLVYLGKQGQSHVFGLEDGIKARPKWRLGFRGELPAELARLLPRAKPPLISNVGMLIIAFLCLGIVYFAAS